MSFCFVQFARCSTGAENLLNVNCKNTFEGYFHFSYEQQDNEGICDNVENRILACQEPGSPYKDNEVFLQEFRKCPGNAGSERKCKLCARSHLMILMTN